MRVAGQSDRQKYDQNDEENERNQCFFHATNPVVRGMAEVAVTLRR